MRPTRKEFQPRRVDFIFNFIKTTSIPARDSNTTFKMEESSSTPIPTPSLATPRKQSTSEAIKNEDGEDNVIDATVTLRQPAEMSNRDFDIVLERLTTRTNLLTASYQIQLQYPSQNDFTLRNYQIQGPNTIPAPPGNKYLRPVMAEGDSQMMGVPWNFGQGPRARVKPGPALTEDAVLSRTWPSFVRSSPQPSSPLQVAPSLVPRPEGVAQSLQRGLFGFSLVEEESLSQIQVTRPPQADPKEPCCQCGSTFHQLKHHPNPNTPEGYLQGCPHCNSLYHRLTTCPHRDAFKDNEWYYLRECRTGLCPVEDFRDFREIHRLDADGRPEYSIEMHLPLTPRWSLGRKYGKERRFQHPLEGGDLQLREDLFWSTADPLVDLGRFGVATAPAVSAVRLAWEEGSAQRRQKMLQQIKDRNQVSTSNDPTTAGFASLSVAPSPTNANPTRRIESDAPHSYQMPVTRASHLTRGSQLSDPAARSRTETASSRDNPAPTPKYASTTEQKPPTKHEKIDKKHSIKRERKRNLSTHSAESYDSNSSTTAWKDGSPGMSRPSKKRREDRVRDCPSRHISASSRSQPIRNRSMTLVDVNSGRQDYLKDGYDACEHCGTQRHLPRACYYCPQR